MCRAVTSTDIQHAIRTLNLTDRPICIHASLRSFGWVDVTIKPPALGAMIEVEFGLTAAFRAVSSSTADLIYKWQARDKGGTWVDLHSAVTTTHR